MGAASDCPGEATDALWQLRLLGGFELSDGRRRITRLSSRAAVTLLARLALWPDRAHAREALVELLWPGVAIDAGRHRLRQILSSLRSVLEPPQREGFEVFEVDRHAIRLRAGAISCDALRVRCVLHRPASVAGTRWRVSSTPASCSPADAIAARRLLDGFGPGDFARVCPTATLSFRLGCGGPKLRRWLTPAGPTCFES